jgi:DNA-damage-inducible protein J
MSKTLTLHTRIEPDIKEKADAILRELGISTTEAINMFLRQVIRYRGLPLDLRVSNPETIAAIREAEEGIDLHKCDNLEQLFKELKED